MQKVGKTKNKTFIVKQIYELYFEGELRIFHVLLTSTWQYSRENQPWGIRWLYEVDLKSDSVQESDSVRTLWLNEARRKILDIYRIDLKIVVVSFVLQFTLDCHLCARSLVGPVTENTKLFFSYQWTRCFIGCDKLENPTEAY